MRFSSQKLFFCTYFALMGSGLAGFGLWLPWEAWPLKLFAFGALVLPALAIKMVVEDDL